MRHTRLVTESIRHYWRTHVGVVAGAAIATAVLVGAMVIGDSVRYSLRRQALQRLGEVHLAMTTRDRFFRTSLAEKVSDATGAPTAGVISLIATCTDETEQHRAGTVDLMGVGDDFLAVRPEWSALAEMGPGEIAVNQRLADELNVREGDAVIVRFDDPTKLSGDLPVSAEEGSSVSGRFTVHAILPGAFSLLANQVAPANAIVRLDWVQQKLSLPDRANMMLVGPAGDEANAPPDVDAANAALAEHWQLTDIQLSFREDPNGFVEMRSSRVFIDPSVSAAARATDANQATGVFTYFVNSLSTGDANTPYSMVAAVGPLKQDSRPVAPLPADLSDDQAVINEWLAEDLDLSSGDTLTMTYYTLGHSRTLQTASREFTVARIVPMDANGVDASLMPEFPGLSGAKNCRDWDMGDAIDLSQIRPKDNTYWLNYRGTPKAYVTLSAGRDMWGNRFGNLTAVRWPDGPAATDRIRRSLRKAMDPASVGLSFLPVRQRALEASGGSQDFGVLFISLSFFLIGAALLLMGLLFAFGIQQRTAQVGTLLAMGWTPWQVRGLLLAEGGVLAVVGSILGTAAGPMYARAMMERLSAGWSGAIAGANLWYHATWGSMLVGAVSGVIAAVVAMGIALWRQAGRSPHELLSGSEPIDKSIKRGALGGGRWSAAVAAVCFLGAGAMLVWGLQVPSATTGAFFGVGTALLVGLLTAAHALLARMGHSDAPLGSLGKLAVRNMGRRRGRSIATMAVLAAGAFLMVTVAANRMNPMKNADQRDSGTGGFALWGQTALPITHNLNTPEGRKNYNLDEDILTGVSFVPLRVREGDDASCLNLNRAQQPRLFGVDPRHLSRREAFSFAQTISDDADSPWTLLSRQEPDNAIPGIADNETLMWAIYKSLGDTVTYKDDSGRPFRVRFVAATSSSILQGVVLVSEDNFVSKYPSIEGYRVFLIDAPDGKADAVADELERGLADQGMQAMPTTERLGAFLKVVNTYLGIFGALGGIGLLLGSLGLGVVVLRNVLERRGELALLRAVGFRKRQLTWMILQEHWLLCVAGLAVGSAAAVIAVVPAIQSAGRSIPLWGLSWTLIGVVANGCLWALGASVLALRGDLLGGLRHE
ncbi:MAG: FtsX-like permease family protein [Phycisphaerae bacterium]